MPAFILQKSEESENLGNEVKNFKYSSPADLREAMDLLQQAEMNTFLLAGGTDLLVQMRRGKTHPAHVIDLKRIPGLEYASKEDRATLRIGALSSLSYVEKALRTSPSHSILADAAASIGSVQIRNKGTIGGNLCNASPSADMAPPLLVFDAQVLIHSARGKRLIPLRDFFYAPGKTVLARNEVVTEIQVPFPPAPAGAACLKLSRRRGMDLPIVGVACLLSLDSNSRCSHVRIALGAVAPTPIRATKAEEVTLGERITDRLIEQVSRITAEESTPISDLRASAEYRIEMIKVLVRRAFEISRSRCAAPIA